ncbi:hypothetical protein B0H66DRAFT_594051 [Apodospora peruviana]|uniref:Uncharacterized protein n=1 Tax=Apodospora peruviana TaxID=516989 RepID=A0AAE0HZH2_9PEZI|nr:hypothetical protein B0H66DRAFT_594051 [Apodospora peruviana]
MPATGQGQTYPTPFTYWPGSTYHWYGVLPTTRHEYPNTTICSTASPTPALVQLTTPAQPLQTGFPAGMRTDDAMGYRFILTRDFGARPPVPWWAGEAAMQLCAHMIGDASPIQGALTVAWVSASSTSFEGAQTGPQTGPPSSRTTTALQTPKESAKATKNSKTASVESVIGGEQRGHQTGNDAGQGTFLQAAPALVSAPSQGAPATVKVENYDAVGTKTGVAEGGNADDVVGTKTGITKIEATDAFGTKTDVAEGGNAEAFETETGVVEAVAAQASSGSGPGTGGNDAYSPDNGSGTSNTWTGGISVPTKVANSGSGRGMSSTLMWSGFLASTVLIWK